MIFTKKRPLKFKASYNCLPIHWSMTFRPQEITLCHIEIILCRLGFECSRSCSVKIEKKLNHSVRTL